MPPAIWLKCLPYSLRQKLEQHPGATRIAENVGWLFSDRILRMGIGLLIGVWLARYLGPEQFGLMNYALAFVALFSVVASLGLNGIVVRDLVNHPATAASTLGTGFVLMLAGGLLATILASTAMAIARPDSTQARLMVLILSLTLVFKAAEIVKYWFEAQVQSKYSVWVENAVFLAQALVKGGLILAQAPLMAFVWLALAEAVLVAAGLLGIYRWQQGGLQQWRWQYARARELVRDSWPLMLSGLAIMVYMRIDQIMLGLMAGDHAVGNYSAAVRISEVWYFIPMAVIASVAPSLLETRKQDAALYYQRLQKLFNGMVLAGLLLALPMTFLSPYLVTLLFGQEYSSAGVILAVHIWTSIFVFLGVASSQWLVAENLQHLALYRTLTGAVINILLNLLLIPAYGGLGAAIGTVISQVFAAYVFDASNPKTRKIFMMKTRALLVFNFPGHQKP